MQYAKTQDEAEIPTGWIEKIKRFKIQLSVASALLLVGVSAYVHYKNERIREELVSSIEEYRKSLLLIGVEVDYDGIDCSGLFSTDCEIDRLRLSFMGKEQMSVRTLRLGDVEEYRKLRDLPGGRSVKASIDIEAQQLMLPKPLMAQLVGQNIGNTFLVSALEKLDTLDLAFRGEFEGDSSTMKHLAIDRFAIDNKVMPIEFSMEAHEVSGTDPDSMVLERFSFSAEDRTISDVTYESVKRLYYTLPEDEKQILLKEFSLQPSDIDNPSKASAAINGAIAGQLDKDAKEANGFIEKRLFSAMAKMFRKETGKITLSGENKANLSVADLQNLLNRTAGMSEESGRSLLKDKFTIEVKSD